MPGLYVTDDAGRRFALPAPPRRVVSLVPSLTELACALGATGRLVGRTRYCTHPANVVARVVSVGGTRTPNCERILALRPDVVLGNAEENRREDIERLEQAGVRVFVTFPVTVAGAARSIRRVGRLLAAEPVAERIAGDIDAARRRLRSLVHRRARVFCPIWRRPWMSFSRDTYAHDLLWCAGGANVCAAAARRYPEVDLADVARSGPQVILLPDEPYRFAARHLASLRALARTPACLAGRVHLVDGRALSWYGPRTPAALWYFHRLLAGDTARL